MRLVKNKILFTHIKKNQQAIVLLLASLFSIIVMLGTNFFLTKLLSKQSFGNYAYIINLFLFSGIVFNLGYFYSLGRLMTLTDSDMDKRQLYSIGLLIVGLLSILMSLSLYLYVYINISDLNEEVTKILYVFIPISLFFLSNIFNESTFQGSNRILLLAFSRVVPKTIFLVLLFIVYVLYKNNMPLQTIFLLYSISLLVSFIYINIKLKPKFINIRNNAINIHKTNREFGLNVYLGSVIAVGSSSLSGLLISYYAVNNVEVGYYSISQQLVAPLGLIPNILATVYFKKFATSNSIDRNLLTFVYGTSFVSFIVIYFMAEPIIIFIYGREYIESVRILHLLSFGMLLYGISDVFNRFLLAKGKGKELRNASYIVGFVLLFSNFILINKFGGMGASMAIIISGFTYFIVILICYLKVIKQYV